MAFFRFIMLLVVSLAGSQVWAQTVPGIARDEWRGVDIEGLLNSAESGEATDEEPAPTFVPMRGAYCETTPSLCPPPGLLLSRSSARPSKPSAAQAPAARRSSTQVEASVEAGAL